MFALSRFQILVQISTVNFRLLVREKAKIHRSHKRVFNGLVVDIHTMWFNSIVPPLHGFCVCMDVSMTSNLKFTVDSDKWCSVNRGLDCLFFSLLVF